MKRSYKKYLYADVSLNYLFVVKDSVARSRVLFYLYVDTLVDTFWLQVALKKIN